MKISEYHLRRIIKEEKLRLLKELHPRDVADAEYDQQLLDDLGGMYSDMYKELYRRRPKIPMFKTIEEAEAAVDKIWAEYEEVNRAKDERVQQDLEFIEMERRRQELMPGEYDIELPMRSGMGRRLENRVRVTKGQLRKIIKEEKSRLDEEGILDKIFGKKVKSLADVTTIGDFKKLIKYAQSSKRAELGKEAAKEWAKSSLWDETIGAIPGMSTAKNAADALKTMYDLPDEARTGTALDHMDIDDDVAKIVDDPIENDYLNVLAQEIEGMDDGAPMSNLNTTKGLQNYLKDKFNSRTVSGIPEGKRVKITKRQLRRIIKEEISRLAEGVDFASLVASGSPLVVSSYVKNMSRARTSPQVLSNMAELWDAMLEAPGDVANSRAVADSLGLAPSLASFHARKLKEGESYPTGDELRAAIEALGPPKPPSPRPRKPYGGGSRQRPWDRST